MDAKCLHGFSLLPKNWGILVTFYNADKFCTLIRHAAKVVESGEQNCETEDGKDNHGEEVERPENAVESDCSKVSENRDHRQSPDEVRDAIEEGYVLNFV